MQRLVIRRVAPGDYEAIYANMPPILLGRVGRLVEARGGYQNARSPVALPYRCASHRFVTYRSLDPLVNFG